MSIMKKRKITKYLARGGGLILLLIGVGYAGLYMHSVLSVLNHPDKSAIFWHTPVLFLGLAGMVGGVTLIIWSTK